MRPYHHALDAWLRDGRPEPMPRTLREHLCSCGSCRIALDQIDEVRGWLALAEDDQAQESASAIRFRLQAAARAQRQSSAMASTVHAAFSLSRIWAGLSGTAALLLALGGAALLVYAAGAPRPALRRQALLAQLEPATGARVERLSTSRGEVYRIRDGSVRFWVPKLTEGRQLWVRVGEDSVVVRGTRFVVWAQGDRLERVSVESGSVAVRLSSGEEVVLATGQSWRAPVPEHVPPDQRAEAPLAAPAQARKKPAGRAQVAGVQAPEATAEDGANQVIHPAQAAFDQAFHEAWTLIRAGRLDAAAYAFDALLRRAGAAPAARRDDALFWSAYAHQRAGRPTIAIERLERLLRLHPQSWHAAKATALLRRLGGVR